ncbi:MULTISPECIES: hypothetical protein [Leptolyngbya]|nr:hypothetical protein [Leptolyngbya sp. FACHB-1624]
MQFHLNLESLLTQAVQLAIIVLAIVNHGSVIDAMANECDRKL